MPEEYEQYDEEFRRKNPSLFRNYREEPVTAETIKEEHEKPFQNLAQLLATSSKLGLAYQAARMSEYTRLRYQQFPFRGGNAPLVDVKATSPDYEGIVNPILGASRFKEIPEVTTGNKDLVLSADQLGLQGVPGFTGESYALESISDIDADSLSISELNSELNNVASNLNYNPANVLTKKIPTRLVPSNIGTPFLQHARAFIKANPNKTLQDFPHLWYKGEPYVVKTRTRINKQTGAKQNEITLEPWRKRVLQRKSTKLSRKQRIQEQSEGVAAGTAVYEKIKQLRELNAKEVAAGLPRSRLRDMDLDHKNALRTVSDYTDGLPPALKKLVYEDLGGEGLFTGDHEKNLILRHRSVHKKLYPELRALLKTLNHKHSGFKSPEERYRYYNTINPKTELTPLQEYAEAIHKVEETGNDLMNDLMKVGTEPEVPEVSGFKSSEPSNEHKDLLIEILGGEADYKAFIHKIKSTPGLPLDLQREFILGEIEHAGKRALEPLTEERAQQMLDEISPDTHRP